MAVDDLSAAGPDRLAAVTARHAQLAAHRPQGRALVEVRRGGDAVLDPPADVIDIVTDDMPFLVDSITMELANHGLSARLVVHPQLRVRRDVTGALREIVGQVSAGQLGCRRNAGSQQAADETTADKTTGDNTTGDNTRGDNTRGDKITGGQRSHDELAESWTHIEIPPLGAGEAEALERGPRCGCSATSGVLSRTTPGCGARRSRWPTTCWRPRARAPAGPMPRPRSPSCCAGWPTGISPSSATGSTTWKPGPDGMALNAVPGTGLGILRHDRVGPGSFAMLPEEVKARALEPQRLIVTKANSRSTVHRPSYLDYVAVKRLSAAGEVVGEYRFLGLYTHAAFSESIKSIPVLRRKLAEVLELSGMAADSHDGKEVAEVLDFYPREELFMTSVSRPGRDHRRRARAAGAAADPAVPAQGRLRPVRVLPGLPAQGPVHDAGQAAGAGDPPASVRRRIAGRLQRPGGRVAGGQAAPRRPRGARPAAARRRPG